MSDQYDERMNDRADQHSLMVQKLKSKMVKKDGVWLDDWGDGKASDCVYSNAILPFNTYTNPNEGDHEQ